MKKTRGLQVTYREFIEKKIDIAPETCLVDFDRSEINPMLKPHQQDMVEILRGKKGGALKAALEIDKLYDQMQADRWDHKAAARFEAMCQELQPEVWVV